MGNGRQGSTITIATGLSLLTCEVDIITEPRHPNFTGVITPYRDHRRSHFSFHNSRRDGCFVLNYGGPDIA